MGPKHLGKVLLVCISSRGRVIMVPLRNKQVKSYCNPFFLLRALS